MKTLGILREAMSTAEDKLDETFEDRCDIRARADQALFHAGDPSDAVYVLTSGFARTYVGEGTTSRTTLLVKAPAILGDRDVIAGCTACDTVRLVSKARLITISREDFLAEWDASAELRTVLTDDLVRRYATTVRWIELNSIGLVERLSRLLKMLGGPQPSIDELAAMLGLSRRSIFRALAELREGKLEVDSDEEPVNLVHSLAAECQPRTADFGIESLDEIDTSDVLESSSVDGGDMARASL